MISERTLKKWRADALCASNTLKSGGTLEIIPISSNLEISETAALGKVVQTYSDRILRLTQELLDAHLLSKVRF